LQKVGVTPVHELPWLVYCDGVWCNTGVEVVAILISPSRVKLRYATRL
jgi:hypothetical protein